VDGSGNALTVGRANTEGQLDDLLVLKYDGSDGTLLWDYRLDGPDHLEDLGWGIAADAAGGCVVTGVSHNAAGEASFLTLRLDADGDELWTRYEPGALQAPTTRAGWVGLAADGDALVANRQWVSGQSFDVFLRRYDAADGSTVWSSGYNSPGNGADDMRHMTLGPDGHMLVTGVSAGDFMTLKIDKDDGGLIWDAFYDGPVGYYDLANFVTASSTGQIFVTGFSDGGASGWDAAVQALDADGNQLWVLRHNGADNLTDEGMALALSPLGDLYLAGYTYFVDTDMDQLALRYAMDVTGLPELALRAGVSVWPHPFTDSATLRLEAPRGARVSVEIFDVTGRRLRRLGGAGELLWDGRDAAGRPVPAGLYLARLRGGGLEGSARLLRVN